MEASRAAARGVTRTRRPGSVSASWGWATWACRPPACRRSGGYAVLGVDVDEARVAALSEGRVPFHEPDLETIVARRRQRGDAAGRNPARAVRTAFVIAVPTPIDAEKRAGSALRALRVRDDRAESPPPAISSCCESTVPPGPPTTWSIPSSSAAASRPGAT